MGKSGKYIRTPKNDPASLALMDEHGVGYSTTGLVAQMRANGNKWQHKDIDVKLAQVAMFRNVIHVCISVNCELRCPQQDAHDAIHQQCSK